MFFLYRKCNKVKIVPCVIYSIIAMLTKFCIECARIGVTWFFFVLFFKKALFFSHTITHIHKLLFFLKKAKQNVNIFMRKKCDSQCGTVFCPVYITKALVVNKSDKMFYYDRRTSAVAYVLQGVVFAAMVVEGSLLIPAENVCALYAL